VDILNLKNTESYTINGITLYASTYLKYKVDTRLLNYLNSEYDKSDYIYDLVMDITCDLGDDYHIEQMIKAVESFYGRNLTMREIKTFIEAYNDYQN
jgi:hypothetical protein